MFTNFDRCPECEYGVISCQPYENGKWIETCTNCDFKQVHSERRRQQRRLQPRHDSADRRKV